MLLLPLFLAAQPEAQRDAAHIYLGIKKLNFLGSVLYVAAHPDDENTRIITYFSRGQLAETAYLAMTRGDGGQNLIGPEIRDQLGLIRTQELLSARRIDGGIQFFTRAVDFGYSKSPEEALAFWGEDEILSDVVKVFRMYQPDVVITRFPTDGRGGHGHHTASAILANEAFDVAGDASRFSGLATQFGTWQPKRLFVNTGRWWSNTMSEDTPGVVTINVGGYNPLLGASYTEIAATSRSQHKTQGFGSRGGRGDEIEYLELLRGAAVDKNIFEGVDTSWSRMQGGDKVAPLVKKAIESYSLGNPAASVPVLLQIKEAIVSLKPGVWRTRKLDEVNDLITDCLGLFLQVTAHEFAVAPGERVATTFELVNRSDVPVNITSLKSRVAGFDSSFDISLKNNEKVNFNTSGIVDAGADYSDPYWLKEPHGVGLFTVKNKDMIGKAENDPAATVTFGVVVSGQKLEVKRPVVYRWTDPVMGEQYRPFEIIPPVTVNMTNNVWIFSDADARDVTVTVRSSGNEPENGDASLKLPAGWKSEPASIHFTLPKRDAEQQVVFRVTPPKEESVGTMQAMAILNGRTYSRSIQTISYDHIPTQVLLPPAEARVVRIDLKENNGTIGYIQGAGDDVPASLRSMGFDVWEMKNEEVTPENLKRLDAVVLGVRALNTNDRIGYVMPDLLAYVKAGGTLVMQYNNSYNLETDDFSPYPLALSRDRVTEEDATVTILNPDHPALTMPNKVTVKDFEGWVQERGLYFPNKWDPSFMPLLSMHDKGEEPTEGSLLVASYGNGYYVYTGLSFFRELPEGVPGAYRLFANLVSLSKTNHEARAIDNSK